MSYRTLTDLLPENIRHLDFNNRKASQLPSSRSSFAFMGVPKAGKDDRVKVFCSQYNRLRLSTGDAFRAYSKSLTHKENEVLLEMFDRHTNEYLSEAMADEERAIANLERNEYPGDYGRARAVIQMRLGDKVYEEGVRNVIQEQFANNQGPFALDGHIRRNRQLHFVIDKLRGVHNPLEGIVLVHRDYDFITSEAPMVTRRFCKDCGSGYKINERKGKNAPLIIDTDSGIYHCPKDETELVIRDDDDPKTVIKRVNEDSDMISRVLHEAARLDIPLYVVPGLNSVYSDDNIAGTLHRALEVEGDSFLKDWQDYESALAQQYSKILN